MAENASFVSIAEYPSLGKFEKIKRIIRPEIEYDEKIYMCYLSMGYYLGKAGRKILLKIFENSYRDEDSKIGVGLTAKGIYNELLITKEDLELQLNMAEEYSKDVVIYRLDGKKNYEGVIKKF